MTLPDLKKSFAPFQRKLFAVAWGLVHLDAFAMCAKTNVLCKREEWLRFLPSLM